MMKKRHMIPLLLSGPALPNRADLLMYCKPVVDTIGVSSITLTTGTADDLMNASWPFPATDAMLALDTLEGGDVFFDSLNAMAPITRFGYEWSDLLNTDFVWLGENGIAGWSTDQGSQARRIYRVLHFPRYSNLWHYTNLDHYNWS